MATARRSPQPSASVATGARKARAPTASARIAAPDAIGRVIRTLQRQHPNADTELHHRNAYELLVATILSAQCTDARVNEVTPALFARFADAAALARADASELERMIQSTGFFRAKTRSLLGASQALVDRFGGDVPADLEALTTLPGVGRKTANVVLGHALGVPGLPVDRHVLRVANRIGFVKSDDPVAVEHALGEALPPAHWTLASDTLILHGRRVCRPKPLCDRCSVRDDCAFVGGALAKAVGRRRAALVTRRATAKGS